MDLIAQQQLLARLFTDKALRERFFSEPESVAPELGVLPEEARQLADTARAEIAAFSQTLVRKRLADLQHVLPHTCRALDGRLAGLFEPHAAAFHPQGTHKHLADAQGFAAYLRRQAPAVASEIAELARYETIRLEFRLGRRLPRLALLRCDLRDLQRTGLPGAGRTLEIWARVAGRVWHAVFGRKRSE